MRISTSQLYQQSLNSMLQQQAELGRANQQMASGKRLLAPADDPAAAARVMGYSETVFTAEQYKTNAQAAQTSLSMEETGLDQALSITQRVRELTVQANNATLSSSDRAMIAQEVRLRLDEALSIANLKDASGDFLFSGYQNSTQPFSGSESAGYSYYGDEGQRLMQVSPERQLATSDSGRQVFGSISTFQVATNSVNTGAATIQANSLVDPHAYQAHTFTINFDTATTFSITDNTNGLAMLTNQAYSSGQPIRFNGLEVTISNAPNANDKFTVAPAADDNVFNVLNRLIKTLETPTSDSASRTQQHTELANTLNGLDQTLNNFTGTLAKVGGRLSSLDNQIQINDTVAYETKKAISEIEDLDYAEAITRFTAQTTALQAAQMAFSRLQGLSLFNYMK